MLDSTKVPDNTDKKNLKTKLKTKLKANSTEEPFGRKLADEDDAGGLTNPAICVQEGASIFFNVDKETGAYPRYFKDSILNTNPDFDYGPFQKLENMIKQGTFV